MTARWIAAASLLFWGYQTGLPVFAGPMALLLVSSAVLPWRWDIPRQDFHRLSDLCALLFAGMAVFLYITREATTAIMMIFQWLPFILFPLVLAQMYSTQGAVDVSTFFISWRKRANYTGPRTAVDITFPYFTACVLAAGATNVRTPVYYLGVVALSAGALWLIKPRRTPVLLWVPLLALAGVLGYQGHVGLHRLQGFVEDRTVGYFYRRSTVGADPYKSHTAIGRIGELKSSGRILLRVRVGGGGRPPALLREASYNLYKNAEWFIRDPRLKPVPPGPAEGSWLLEAAPRPERIPKAGRARRPSGLDAAPERPAGGSVSVAAYFPKGRGVLALPDGAFSVEGLPAAGLNRNRLGAVSVLEGPGLARYAVRHHPSVIRDAPPDATDLELPEAESGTLRLIAARLKLEEAAPAEAVTAVEAFFERGFTYRLFQTKADVGEDPLGNFLLKTKSGHCEYFATATALLLRAAGVPARYASGYSVQEYSRLEKSHVVRDRHAHAWTRAYVDGAWRDVDTTPADWAALEAGRASPWRALTDLWALARHRFSEWRWSSSEGGGGRIVLWVLLALAAYPSWRLYRRLREAEVSRGPGAGPVAARRSLPGRDSEFYAVERDLEAEGMGRRPEETLTAWLLRIEETGGPAVGPGRLRGIVSLHTRYRFDPSGLDERERAALAHEVGAWREERGAASHG